MAQNHFRPLHEAHAIAEQMVFFQFAPELNREMPALIGLKDEMRDELPVSEVLKAFQVEISDSGAPSQETKEGAGLQMRRFGPSGTVAWSINIVPDSISFHCTDYSRWNEVWDRHKKYIKIVFSKIPKIKSFLLGVGVKWIDQFIYEGDVKSYDVSEILRKDSRFLSPSSFDAGLRWHCHTGWFDDDLSVNGNILNQLNVASAEINVSGHARTVVTIDHTLQLRAIEKIDQLADLLPITEDAFKSLSDLMETLHNGNKRVLASVLNDSACERIGLRLG